MKYSTGSVIVNLCAEKFWKRNILQMGISLYQRILLWMLTKKRWQNSFTFSASKKQRRKAERATHIMIDIGEAAETAGVKYRYILSVTFPVVEVHRVEVDDTFNKHLLDGQYLPLVKPLNSAMRTYVSTWGWLLLESKSKKYYDFLQLLSFAVNLPLWFLIPSTLGKEVIKLLGIGKGNQVCSTGAIAALRFAEAEVIQGKEQDKKEMRKVCTANSTMSFELKKRRTSRFIADFDTAVVSPALFLAEGSWQV